MSKKKVKLLDTFLESLKKKWENASIRDIVYLTSYIAAIGVSYKAISIAQGLPAIMILDIIEYVRKKMMGEPTEPEEINLEILLTSCVAAYMILKIDMDDITAAVGKITSLAASMGSVTPG